MSGAPSIAEFEDEVRTFLEANAQPRATDEAFEWGKGSDEVAVFDRVDRETERGQLAQACDFRRNRFDAGLGWITGPGEYGGRGLSQAHQRAYDALEARYDVPGQTFFAVGLGMVAPTILAHGTAPAKDAYLRALHRADIVGCQLFSEPGAGSDLASVQTRAERDGDEWVLNGQKVWTSGAHYSDIGEIVARTDVDQPKHQGISAFIVDMKAPGVEVRPLRQMTGSASFNEVFFTDVRVRADHLLGEVNQGWTVALTTLMNERASIGAGGVGGGSASFLTRAIAMTKAFGLADDPTTRQALADLIIHARVQRYNNQRAMDKIRSGQLPGPELSTAKLAGTMQSQRLAAYVSRVLGPKLVADTGEWGTYAWSQFVLGNPGGRLAGGTDEVMRNIVGERVLGLPKDPGIDTTSPFRDLSVGTQSSQG